MVAVTLLAVPVERAEPLLDAALVGKVAVGFLMKWCGRDDELPPCYLLTAGWWHAEWQRVLKNLLPGFSEQRQRETRIH